MLNTVYRHHSDLFSKTVGQEVHVLNLEWENEIMVISGHAGRVWLAVDGHKTVEQLITELMLELPASIHDQFKQDAQHFLFEMEEKKMLIQSTLDMKR